MKCCMFRPQGRGGYFGIFSLVAFSSKDESPGCALLSSFQHLLMSGEVWDGTR